MHDVLTHTYMILLVKMYGTNLFYRKKLRFIKYLKISL